MSGWTEAQWERRLNISTAAARFEKDDRNHSRYEPTAYAVLYRLAESGRIGREDVLVDYGCGKGRVSFFMSHAVGCRSVGVEYDERLHEMAEENLAGYAGRRELIAFARENAENFSADGANAFYFFNPFSVRILSSVLGRIYESYYENPRRIQLFFYYATDEYMTYLMAEDLLRYAGGIDCRDLFDGGNEKERIVIFEID